jgi:hypothetical protein
MLAGVAEMNLGAVLMLAGAIESVVPLPANPTHRSIMRSTKTAMRAWLSKATAAEKRQVAKSAGTSVKYLENIAAGRRSPSAGLAQRLAKASGGALLQQELCHACGQCPLVRN